MLIGPSNGSTQDKLGVRAVFQNSSERKTASEHCSQRACKASQQRSILPQDAEFRHCVAKLSDRSRAQVRALAPGRRLRSQDFMRSLSFPARHGLPRVGAPRTATSVLAWQANEEGNDTLADSYTFLAGTVLKRKSAWAAETGEAHIYIYFPTAASALAGWANEECSKDLADLY